MTGVKFLNEKSRAKTHTLTAGLNLNGQLVFDDGEHYAALGSEGQHEVDDYLTIRVEYKKQVLRALGDVFLGVSETCGTNDDERLLSMLERAAHREYWKSLGDVERWLMDRNIPFTKQRRADTK